MCDFIKSFADLNQGTLHLVTRCFREMYDRNEFCAVLLFFNYTLPSFEDDSITFMLMTLLFDVSFKDWFVGVYMENMVPMLRDTLHRMLDPHYINPLLDRARENENGRNMRQRNAIQFARTLAETQLRRQISRQRQMEERQRRREAGEEVSDAETEDDQLDTTGIEIPDDEVTQHELQLLQTDFLRSENSAES